MSGKCPKCEKLMTYVNIEPMTANQGATKYNGVAYKCPYCHTVVSFQMDPLALKADTVRAIKGG